MCIRDSPGEGLADALVLAGSEGEEGGPSGAAAVLPAFGPEVERFGVVHRVAVQGGEAVEQLGAGRDPVRAELDRHLGGAHQEGVGRVQPHHLLGDAAGVREPGERLGGGDGAGGQVLVQLGEDPGLRLRVAEQFVEQPGQRGGDGLGARAEHGDRLGADVGLGERPAGGRVGRGAQQAGQSAPARARTSVRGRAVDGLVDHPVEHPYGGVEAPVDGQRESAERRVGVEGLDDLALHQVR